MQLHVATTWQIDGRLEHRLDLCNSSAEWNVSMQLRRKVVSAHTCSDTQRAGYEVFVLQAPESEPEVNVQPYVYF